MCIEVRVWVSSRGPPFLADVSVQRMLRANEYLCWWAKLFLTHTHIWVIDDQCRISFLKRRLHRSVNKCSEETRKHTLKVIIISQRISSWVFPRALFLLVVLLLNLHSSPCYICVCVWCPMFCPSAATATFLSLAFWVMTGQRLQILNVLMTESFCLQICFCREAWVNYSNAGFSVY